jgi:hypothetical protein
MDAAQAHAADSAWKVPHACSGGQMLLV